MKNCIPTCTDTGMPLLNTAAIVCSREAMQLRPLTSSVEDFRMNGFPSALQASSKTHTDTVSASHIC